MTHRVGELGVFNTPAAVQHRLEQLRVAAKSLNADVERYKAKARAADGSFSADAAARVQSWAGWFVGFEAFQPDWADRAWGTTASQVESYAEQLEAWRKKVAGWPGAAVTAPSAGFERNPLDSLAGVLRGTGLVIGGTVLGLGALLLLGRNRG